MAALSEPAGDQVNVDAPPALNIIELPLQIVPLLMTRVGKAFTVTVVVVLLLHPAALLPFIV